MSSLNADMCPKGVDPITPFANYRSINITISAIDGSLEGFVRLKINSDSILLPANGNSW